MKRTAIVMLVLILPLLLFAESDETQDAVDALVGTIDLSEWDAWFQKYGADDAILPSGILKQLVGMQASFDKDDTIVLLEKLTLSFKPVLAKTALLMGLAALGAAIDGITVSASVGETAGEAFRVCVSVTVLAISLTEMRTAFSAVRTVERTAELFVPVIVGYLSLCGCFRRPMRCCPTSFCGCSKRVLHRLQSRAAF